LQRSSLRLGRERRTSLQPEAAIDLFANLLLQVHLSEIAENDHHVLYTVRVPREALLGSDPYPTPGLADEKFCADVAAYLAARIRELTALEPAALA
jgi:hypothetical protein